MPPLDINTVSAELAGQIGAELAICQDRFIRAALNRIMNPHIAQIFIDTHRKVPFLDLQQNYLLTENELKLAIIFHSNKIAEGTFKWSLSTDGKVLVTVKNVYVC